MKNNFKFLFACLILGTGVTYAQVGVGTTTPDSSSILDVTSTTKGLLIPRMSTTERVAIVSPAAGLQVYDTTTNTNWYHNGTAWVNSGAAINGSKFTNDASNTSVRLTNLSDGTTSRPAGTEFIISDNGNVAIGTTNISTASVLQVNASNGNQVLVDKTSGSLTLESGSTSTNEISFKTNGIIGGYINYNESNNGLNTLMIRTRGAGGGSSDPKDIALQTGNLGVIRFSPGDGEVMRIVPGGLVGIGTTTPNASAVLDINSTTRGVLLPRLDLAQRAALVNPPTWLTIMDTSAEFGSIVTNVGTPAAPIWETGSNILAGYGLRTKYGMGFNTNGGGYFSSGGINYSGQGTSGFNYGAGFGTNGGYYFTDGGSFSISTFLPAADNTGLQATLSRIDAFTVANRGNVGVGNANPNASAALDITSTSQGFLPPRMTLSQMGSIPTPAEGLVVYCNNCTPKGLRVFNGTGWADMNGVAPGIAAFTFTGNFNHDANFTSGKVMGTDNTLYLEVNVTTAGQITISSNTVNGYSFSSIPITTSTGIQLIQITPSGTQTAFNAAGDAFTITGVGTTTQTQAVTIIHSQLGSALTSFSNGTENFSANTNCAGRVHSVSTAGNCPATVTVGSNTYNTVFINGQCWMRENLNEAPTAPCAAAINTGCNIWTNTISTDLGRWGYYNTATISGSAGWGTAVPATNEGLLYQWSAAMNGSTIERAKGVCPTGWHIPSDCEFMYLEHGQGMSIANQVTNNAWRTNGDVGRKLANFASGSTNPSTSGFNVLAAGRRGSNGAFNNRTTIGGFWTSSQANTNLTTIRHMQNNNTGVFRLVQNAKADGYSVRCLKD